MTAQQWGPARYRVVYADGQRGYERTLVSALDMLERRRHWTMVDWPHGKPVRVEPVAGTQYRGTWGGRTFDWRDDADMANYAASAGHHKAPALRLTALELRSPVQP